MDEAEDKIDPIKETEYDNVIHVVATLVEPNQSSYIGATAPEI